MGDTDDGSFKIKRELEYILRIFDNHKRNVKVILSIMLVVSVIFLIIEINHEMNFADVCSRNNMTYRYSLQCISYEDSFGNRELYGALRLDNGTTILKYYGLLDKPGVINIP